jgi:hypothetical protein
MKSAKTSPSNRWCKEGYKNIDSAANIDAEKLEEWIHSTARRIADVIKMTDEQEQLMRDMIEASKYIKDRDTLDKLFEERKRRIEEKTRGRGGGEVFTSMMRALARYFACIGLDEGLAKNLIFYITMGLCEDNRSREFEAIFEEGSKEKKPRDSEKAFRMLRSVFSEGEARKIHSLFFPRRKG